MSKPDVINDWQLTYRYPHHCSESRAATGYQHDYISMYNNCN